MCLAFAIHFLHGTDDTPTPRRDRTLRAIMGALMLWLAVGCIYGCLSWVPSIFGNIHVRRLLILLDLMTLPLIFLMLTNLARRKPITTWRVIKYIVPMICLLPLCFLDIPYFDIAFLIAAAIYVLLMTFHMLVAIIRFQRYMHDQYSDGYGRSLRWLYFVIGLLLIALSSWLGFVFCDTPLFRIFFYLIHLTIWPLICLNVGRIIRVRENSRTDSETLDEAQIADSAKDIDTSAHEQTMMEEDNNASSAENKGAAAPRLTPEEVFSKKLKSVCEETKLFTTEDLTREELARAMMMNHTYLTKMLKQTTGKSFYEYINGLRMDYATQLLRDPDFPLDAIPMEVGYRHRSTYYRVFADTYGCTPTEYRAKQTAAQKNA